MLFDNPVADAEAESGALSNFLGGEERVEDLIGMGDALAVVRERHFNKVAGFGGRDFDASGRSDFVDGVIGVVKNIQEDLLQLMSIADDFRQDSSRCSMTSMP